MKIDKSKTLNALNHINCLLSKNMQCLRNHVDCDDCPYNNLCELVLLLEEEILLEDEINIL
jgi:hypothetical protein